MPKKFIYPLIFVIGLIITTSYAHAATYYVSPTGNDTNSGTSTPQPWNTFDRAWQSIYPGDTLYLMDGTYKQSLNPNKRNGQPGNPITIKALNDGQAIIDGEHQRVPVAIGGNWAGDPGESPVGNYFILEGIVAQNSNGAVIHNNGGDYNIYRRVSAYNANPDTNSMAIALNGDNNLIEDCIAAGTGRKMLYTYKGQYNIIRRCYAQWHRWDGKTWHDIWPWGDSIEVYIGNNNTIENSISYGPIADFGFNIQALGTGNTAIGNKILGSIAIGVGMNQDGTVKEYAKIRPQPSQSSPDHLRDYTWLGQRVGFQVRGDGDITDNLWQDIFSYSNAGLGFSTNPVGVFTNNRINQATIVNNGLDGPGYEKNTDAAKNQLDQFAAVSNSYIKNIRQGNTTYPALTGSGAVIQNRYIDGVLTGQSLWPWPMESRIQAELNMSLTNAMADIFDNLPAGVPKPANIQKVSYNGPVNQPPTVNIGPDRTTTPNTYINLNATVNDDGLPGGQPNPTGALYLHWSPESGPGTSTFSNYHTPTTTVAFSNPGTYVIKLIAYDGWITRSDSATITVNSDPGSTPFPIPGKIEAENFINSNGAFQVKTTNDTGGGYKIGGVTAGAWLEYNVDISQSGTYDLIARTASGEPNLNKQFTLLINGNPLTTVNPTHTGGWDTFVDITVPGLNLNQGQYTLRLTFITGYFDLNYLTFQLPGTPLPTATPIPPTPTPTPGGGSCPGDANSDLLVNLQDLIAIITGWGSTPDSRDVDGNGKINAHDFRLSLSEQGRTC